MTLFLKASIFRLVQWTVFHRNRQIVDIVPEYCPISTLHCVNIVHLLHWLHGSHRRNYTISNQHCADIAYHTYDIFYIVHIVEMQCSTISNQHRVDIGYLWLPSLHHKYSRHCNVLMNQHCDDISYLRLPCLHCSWYCWRGSNDGKNPMWPRSPFKNAHYINRR